MGYFLPFYPPDSPKNKIFKKWKKGLEVSPFYTCASKISIRWCTVPEIWSATYGWKRWHIEVGAHLKTPGDIITLHRCIKNLNDIIYSSSNIERDRLKFVISGHFVPFYPLKTLKTKILKKWKKWLKISFYTSTKNHIHRCVVPEIQSETDRIFSRFGPFFALSPH